MQDAPPVHLLSYKQLQKACKMRNLNARGSAAVLRERLQQWVAASSSAQRQQLQQEDREGWTTLGELAEGSGEPADLTADIAAQMLKAPEDASPYRALVTAARACGCDLVAGGAASPAPSGDVALSHRGPVLVGHRPSGQLLAVVEDKADAAESDDAEHAALQYALQWLALSEHHRPLPPPKRLWLCGLPLRGDRGLWGRQLSATLETRAGVQVLLAALGKIVTAAVKSDIQGNSLLPRILAFFDAFSIPSVTPAEGGSWPQLDPWPLNSGRGEVLVYRTGEIDLVMAVATAGKYARAADQAHMQRWADSVTGDVAHVLAVAHEQEAHPWPHAAWRMFAAAHCALQPLP